MLASGSYLSIPFLLIAQTLAQDSRSLRMKTMAGQQFTCVNTTCPPFSTSTVRAIRYCKIACLSQIRCKALSFRTSSSACALFNDIPYPTANMSSDADTTTMIVIAGTRTPSVLLPLADVNGTIPGVWNTTAGGDSTAAGSAQHSSGGSPAKACDNILSTKYATYGSCGSNIIQITCGVNTGLYMQLQRGSSLVTGLQLCAADDYPQRDPMTVTLEGSNLSGTALTLGSSWTLIYNGLSGLQTDPGRMTCGRMLSLNNTMYFRSYRFLVSSKRASEDSVQYSELRLYGC